ncbi:MAG: hypothetical protein J6B48_10295 [Clostridia bacterium]|nr:hypothetical protein [Clostridia bacterium]
MKKSILLFAILALLSAFLCSCKLSGENSKDNTQKGDPQDTVTDTSFLAEGKQFYFVSDEGMVLHDKIIGIYTEILYSTGKHPIYITSEEEGGEYEIVFGQVEREISTKAYFQLSRYYTGIPNESVWLIYVKDNSLCVAFDTDQAKKKAIEYLDENIGNESFGTKKGVVAYECFDTVATAAEEREAKQASSLNSLVSKLGADAVESLKNLYSLYDEDLYIWMANLWCPDVGGFYYSNSGRNTEGFLPDIESTKQILSFLNTSGMLETYTSKDYGKALLQDYPEIAEKLLNFAISLQDEDGYFYHPQWKDTPSTSRLGRDLGNARQIISAFGGTPTYPYPDVQVPETDGDAVGASAKLTGRLQSSGVSAVSKVVATAAPAYLQSLDKWAAYIDSLNIDKGGSYVAGNTLNAQKTMIKAAGQQYVDYLINYLNDKLCDNGTWEPEISYSATNGLMKCSTLYEYFGVQFPKAKEATETCIKRTIDMTPKPEGGDHVCDNYNTWYTLAELLRIVGKTDPALRAELRQMVFDNLPEMLESTVKKVSPYRKDDGSFSYYQTTTSYTSQGSVVAVAGTNEGDVNSTCLSSSGLLKNIFGCIGVSMVPMYYSADFEIFMDTIYDLGSIIKDEAPDPTPITFDEVDTSVNQTTNGINSQPDDMIDITVRDKDIEGAEYKWLDCEVVESPAQRNEEDNAIRFEVITKPCTCDATPCTCKQVATTASSIYCKMQNSTILGDTFVTEFDYYLDKWGKDDVVNQLTFVESIYGGSSMSFNLSTYKGSDGNNYLRVWDNSEGLDGMKNSSIVSGIPVKEWVHFRFELYKTKQPITDEETGEVKQYLANVCKIYVNGEYAGESDAAQLNTNGTTLSKHVNAFSISGYRHTSSVIYVDNVLAYRTNTEYVCEEEPGNSVLDNMAVNKSQTVATFEDGKTATYYLKNLAVPGYIRYSVEEIAGKKALYVYKYGIPDGSQTYTQAKITNPDTVGECYTYETKIYYDGTKMKSGQYITQMSFSGSGSLSFLGFNLKFYGTYVEMQHNKNYLNGSSIESSGKVKGIDGEAVNLPVNEWFTFKIEFYRADVSSESMVKIYTGDENGENMVLRAEFNAYRVDRTDAIERFVFTHYREVTNVSVYLDDISFRRSDKAFVSELPDENVDSFDDGYVSGDVRTSDNTADSTYTGIDSVSAGKDPKNNTNNVMKITSSSASATPYVVTIKHSGSQITNGLSAFETKLFVESAGNGTFATIAFVGTNGAVQELTLNKGDDGKVFIALPDGYTVTSNDFTSSNSKNKLTLGEWNTLRIEFTNADDEADAFVEVFINGSSIGKLVGYKSTKNVHTVTIAGSGASSAMYLDDVSYREYLLTKEVISGSSANDLTTVTPGETFDGLGGSLIGDGSDSNVKFGKTDGYALTYTQPDDTIIVTSDPTGAKNDILMFLDGSTSSHSTVWVAASGNKYGPSAQKYVLSVFETKLYIEKPKANSDTYLAQLFFTTGQTARTSAINVIGTKVNGEYAYAYFSLLGSDNTKNRVEFNKWYTLRIEYHNGSEGTTLTPYIEIFLNGESVGQKEATKSNGTFDYNDVNSFFWKSFSSGLATVYFDNISYTEKQMDYPAAPETPIVPDEPSTPSEPDTPAIDSHIETFEGLTTLKGDGTDSVVQFGVSAVDSKGTTADGDEIAIIKDPTGADNNVLMFKDGSTSSFSSIWIPKKSANGDVTNGISVFETKLYIPKSEILTAGGHSYSQPRYVYNGRSKLHAEDFYVSGDKSTVYFVLDNTDGSETSRYITTDAWHTLRLEFYNYSTVEESPIIKVYIDNLYAGYMTTTAVKDASGFMWSGLSWVKYTIYFDDMSFTEKAMPTK